MRPSCARLALVALGAAGLLAAAANAALAVAGTAVAGAQAQGPAPPPTAATPRLAEGRQLYLTGCSSCHGMEGFGTAQGPPLLNAGAASAFYYLSTGRMPLTNPGDQPRRKQPAYSPEEIELLVGYVASLGDGPPVPDVDPAKGDLSAGGVLYRANCAPCHSAAGIGGALSYGRAAPPLDEATPAQVASAMRIGPGQMPVFGRDTFDQNELNSIVAYVQRLASPANPGGARLGSAGPLPEGFVAWVFGMGALLVASVWIGQRLDWGRKRAQESEEKEEHGEETEVDPG